MTPLCEYTFLLKKLTCVRLTRLILGTVKHTANWPVTTLNFSQR